MMRLFYIAAYTNIVKYIFHEKVIYSIKMKKIDPQKIKIME